MISNLPEYVALVITRDQANRIIVIPCNSAKDADRTLRTATRPEQELAIYTRLEPHQIGEIALLEAAHEERHINPRDVII